MWPKPWLFVGGDTIPLLVGPSLLIRPGDLLPEIFAHYYVVPVAAVVTAAAKVAGSAEVAVAPMRAVVVAGLEVGTAGEEIGIVAESVVLCCIAVGAETADGIVDTAIGRH